MGETGKTAVTLPQLLENARQAEALSMRLAQAVEGELAGKQDTLTGTAGQVVGFDAEGRAVAQEAPGSGSKASEEVLIGTSEGDPYALEIPNRLKGKTLLIEFVSRKTDTKIEAQVYGVPYGGLSDIYSAFGCEFYRYGDTIYWGDFNQSAAGMYLRFTEL